jgi:Mg/Co/Ni transporter MgtE
LETVNYEYHHVEPWSILKSSEVWVLLVLLIWHISAHIIDNIYPLVYWIDGNPHSTSAVVLYNISY